MNKLFDNKFSSELLAMLEQARVINKINDDLKNKNPEVFNKNTSLSIVKDNIATIVVTSSAMAFRLNLLKDKIINLLQQYPELGEIEKCNIKVS